MKLLLAGVVAPQVIRVFQRTGASARRRIMADKSDYGKKCLRRIGWSAWSGDSMRVYR